MELVILDLATLGAVTSILMLCALGVAVLPWTNDELRQTISAAREVPHLLQPVLRACGVAVVAAVAPARPVSPARR